MPKTEESTPPRSEINVTKETCGALGEVGQALPFSENKWLLPKGGRGAAVLRAQTPPRGGRNAQPLPRPSFEEVESTRHAPEEASSPVKRSTTTHGVSAVETRSKPSLAGLGGRLILMTRPMPGSSRVTSGCDTISIAIDHSCRSSIEVTCEEAVSERAVEL